MFGSKIFYASLGLILFTKNNFILDIQRRLQVRAELRGSGRDRVVAGLRADRPSLLQFCPADAEAPVQEDAAQRQAPSADRDHQREGARQGARPAPVLQQGHSRAKCVARSRSAQRARPTRRLLQQERAGLCRQESTQ